MGIYSKHYTLGIGLSAIELEWLIVFFAKSSNRLFFCRQRVTLGPVYLYPNVVPGLTCLFMDHGCAAAHYFHNGA